MTRAENPITAVTFQAEDRPAPAFTGPVQYLRAETLPGELEPSSFNVIVGIDLIDQRNCTAVLAAMHKLLVPGGQIVLYESNPWNFVLNIRRAFGRLLGAGDSRRLLARSRLYELRRKSG